STIEVREFLKMNLGRILPQSATRAWLRIAMAALVMQSVITGCAAPQRLPAVPATATTKADPGLGPIRFMVRTDTASFAMEAKNSLRKERAWLASKGHVGSLPPVNFLAISGGGDNGAFGAGLLNGRAARGTPPAIQGGGG